MGNFSKKIASTVSMTAIVASAMGASLVSAASEFAPYAEALANHNVINKQTTEAGYRLGDNITRAELAKVAANLGGYTSVACSGTVYSDVKQNLGDLCDAIETLAAAGVVTKANATFRPNANVTRAEMTKMLVGAVGGTPSTVDAGYADTANLGDLTGFINKAREMGAIGAATNFRPNANGSRGEVFKIAAKVANIEVPNVEDTTNPTPTPSQTGSISVSAVGSPAAQYVPKNASSVKVGTVKLMANGGDVTISSLVVTRSGLGATTDIKADNGIRAAVAGKIISSTSDYYNSNNQQGMIYISPSISLKKGESLDVDILVSLNSDAEVNSQHQFAVTAVNNANITPVTLGLLNTTAYKTSEVVAKLKNEPSTLERAKNNQHIVDVEITSSDREVKVTGFSVARNYTSTHGIPVGDLTKILSNVKVTLDGSTVGTATVAADKIFITGLDTVIGSGKKKTYQIRADVLLDSVSNAIALKLEDSSDVSGVEVSTNQVFRVDVSTHNSVDISLGKVNNSFTRTTSGEKTVSPGTDDVEFLNAKLTSTTPIRVRELKITPKSTTLTAAGINGKFELRHNGLLLRQIDAAAVLVGTTIPNLTILVDGDTPAELTLEADLTDAATGNARFDLELVTVQDLSSRPATLRTKEITSHTTKVEAGTLEAIQQNSSTTSTRISKNETYKIAEFSLRAKTEDIRSVKEIEIENKGNLADLAEITDAADDYVLYNGNNKVSTTTTVTPTGIKFVLNEDIRIVKNTSEAFSVQVTTKDTLPTSVAGNTIQLALKEVKFKPQTSSAIQTVALTSTIGKKYTIGLRSPSITLTPIEGNGQRLVVVRVTNESSDPIVVKNVTLDIAGRTSGGDLYQDVTKALLSDAIGSTPELTSSAGKVNGDTFEFPALDPLNVASIASNSSQEFVVSLGNTIVANGDTLNVKVKSLTYGADAATATAEDRSDSITFVKKGN